MRLLQYLLLAPESPLREDSAGPALSYLLKSHGDEVADSSCLLPGLIFAQPKSHGRTTEWLTMNTAVHASVLSSLRSARAGEGVVRSRFSYSLHMPNQLEVFWRLTLQSRRTSWNEEPPVVSLCQGSTPAPLGLEVHSSSTFAASVINVKKS